MRTSFNQLAKSGSVNLTLEQYHLLIADIKDAQQFEEVIVLLTDIISKLAKTPADKQLVSNLLTGNGALITDPPKDLKKYVLNKLTVK